MGNVQFPVTILKNVFFVKMRPMHALSFGPYEISVFIELEMNIR